MKKFADVFERLFKKFLPSPLGIALVLTGMAFGLAAIWGHPVETGAGVNSDANSNPNHNLFTIWFNGLWGSSTLAFAVQMMLMLVIGHMLALSPPIKNLITFLSSRFKTPATATAALGLATIVVALFNWGLGLVFGAILARQIKEDFARRGLPINYPLLGAAGYSGLMVWHGGLSGSAPLKAAEANHITEMMAFSNATFPAEVTMDQTVFSALNGGSTLALLILLPATLYFLAKRTSAQPVVAIAQDSVEPRPQIISGAEWIDHGRAFSLAAGLIFLVAAAMQVPAATRALGFLTPNFINTVLFGLALLLHPNIKSFSAAAQEAIGDATGILLQFPLYFGIMGLIRDTGLVNDLALFFSSISTAETFPLFTLVSSGIINVFVPSGGGQWAVQGPILMQTAQELGVPYGKAIMSLAYGDQLTNMLQPFWALPLLGITGLKAKEILPYTCLLMLVGGIIFTIALLL